MFSKVLNVICLPIETSIWRWEPICVIILDNSISLSEFWSTEIVINVQNVGKKWLGENFLFVHLLNGFILSNFTFKFFLKKLETMKYWLTQNWIEAIFVPSIFVSSRYFWMLFHPLALTYKVSKESTEGTELAPRTSWLTNINKIIDAIHGLYLCLILKLCNALEILLKYTVVH